MKIAQSHLLGIALALSAIALMWSYLSFIDSTSELERAVVQRSKHKELVEEILFLDQATGEAGVVAAKNFDPSKSIVSAISAAGMSIPANSSLSQTKLGKINGTEVREWKLDLLELVGTASQVSQFIRRLANSEFNCQVESVRLESKKQDNRKSGEKWDVEMDLRFLREER